MKRKALEGTIVGCIKVGRYVGMDDAGKHGLYEISCSECGGNFIRGLGDLSRNPRYIPANIPTPQIAQV